MQTNLASMQVGVVVDRVDTLGILASSGPCADPSLCYFVNHSAELQLAEMFSRR